MARQYRVPKAHPLMALAAGAAAGYPAGVRARAERALTEKELAIRERGVEAQEKYWTGLLKERAATREFEVEEAEKSRLFTLKRDEAQAALQAGNQEKAARLQAELEKDLYKFKNPLFTQMASAQLESLRAGTEATRAGVEFRGRELELTKERIDNSLKLGWAQVQATQRGQDLQMAIANVNTAGRALIAEYDYLTRSLADQNVRLEEPERLLWRTADYVLMSAITTGDEGLAKAAIPYLESVQKIARKYGVHHPIEYKVKNGVPVFRDLPILKHIPGLGRRYEPVPAEPTEPTAPEAPPAAPLLNLIAPRVAPTETGFEAVPGRIETPAAVEPTEEILNTMRQHDVYELNRAEVNTLKERYGLTDKQIGDIIATRKKEKS